MVSGFVCPCHGFMKATINGIQYKSYLLFEAGKNREGMFTNKDLNDQIDATYLLSRHYHPADKYDRCFAFDISMTHKAKSPDGLDATKINRSDGGAGVTLQRDGWFDTVTEGVCVRTAQKMQNEAGVQLGMLSILKAREKSCMKLPDGSYFKSDLCQL